MTKNQKLELTWIGKEKRPRLEPPILLEDTEKSYHAKHWVSNNDIFDNDLIFGEPVKGHFHICYKLGTEQPEYIPDFIAVTDTTIFMVAE